MHKQHKPHQNVLLIFVILFLSAASLCAQSRQRIIQWDPNAHYDPNIKSSVYTELPAQIEALEITEVLVGGKAITLGQTFEADDEWIQNLTVRIKNVSKHTFNSAQMSFWLPEIMPGGPLVTLCYACGSIEMGETISPGEEVEMKLVFYPWLLREINKKSSLSMITKAEVWNFVVTLTDGGKWLSACMKTANEKNACPKLKA